MARIHETAYPLLKAQYSSKEVLEIFTPTEEEIALMETITRPHLPEKQLGFMMLLKGYQCVGRPIKVDQLPDMVLRHLAHTLKINTNTARPIYTKATRRRHLDAIRRYLNINLDPKARRFCMKKAALEAAETKADLVDIVNEVIDHLIKERYEIPGYHSLLRLARASRKVVHRHYDAIITNQLSDETKKILDTLFDISHEKTSLWWAIKQDAQTPTTKSIREFLTHLSDRLNLKFQVPFDLNSIPPVRLDTFISEAISLDASDMKKLKPMHRYALAILLINMQAATGMDDLCTTIILWMRKLHTNAETELEDYRKKNANTIEHLLELLYQFTTQVKVGQTDAEYLLAIDNTVTKEPDDVIEACEKHRAYAGGNYYPFMLKPYKDKRSLFFKIINFLEMQSTTHDMTIPLALDFLKQHAKSKKLWLDLIYENAEAKKVSLDISWLSERWFKMVTGKTKGSAVTQIHRHYFEIALMDEIADALDAGDIYVNNAYDFDDPNKQLISWETFYQKQEEYCQLIQQPSDPKIFSQTLQQEFRTIAEKVDKRFPENHLLSFKDGLPILKQADKKDTPPRAKQISDKIEARMPPCTIVDVIFDVERWMHLSQSIKPLSGFETKIPEHEHSLRFVSNAFSYGCNVGPTETARCLQQIFNRKQIAWMFNHQITEQLLDQLSIKVINQYNQFELPKNWGPGDSLSVDATFWDMFKKNLIAAHHIRYGGFGGLGYYHVSDNYIALYGNFIACGVHESNYVFDGIMANKSDTQPDKVHGDTGAQKEVTFGFGYLLAIYLMPRIRCFKHLRYYKPAKTDTFQHLEELFCNESIDWDLIELHYHDMLRVVMSVHQGKVKASTILRRLSAKSRKNKLYYAFRELGRVIRTMFLLKYIDDLELRRMIQAGTCKSEEFNEFISWVRFGDGGIVGDNKKFNQQKIIKFGHLVANMVSLHVVANMTQVINDLKQGGEDIPDEILACYSPYRRAHLTRLGIFPLDFDRKSMALVYELIKNQTSSENSIQSNSISDLTPANSFNLSTVLLPNNDGQTIG